MKIEKWHVAVVVAAAILFFGPSVYFSWRTVFKTIAADAASEEQSRQDSASLAELRQKREGFFDRR
jgi:hypothetical protein